LKYPKVLIGTPIYKGKEYIRKEFVQRVKELTYPNFDFLLVDNSKGTSYTAKLRRDGLRVVRTPRGNNARDALRNSENYLIERVVNGEYEYLFMLESDVIPHRDVIQRLMAHMDPHHIDITKGKRIIGCPYHIGLKTKNLCIAQLKYYEDQEAMGCEYLTPGDERDFIGTGLQKVHAMGVGCTLMHRSLFELNLPIKGQPIRFWYSTLDDIRMADTVQRKWPDTYFYLDLENNKVPVYCDSDQYVLHKPSSKDDLNA